MQAHRGMVFDNLRNRFYLEAIQRAIGEDTVVLDLGAGLGLHGLIAAGKGAAKVYLVEPAPVAEVARQLVKANGLQDRVECLIGRIEDISIRERVDVIISVFTGNFLLTEDLLPSLFHARDKYLKTGGRLIPDRATMEVVPVSAPEYYAKHVDCWGEPSFEIDLEIVRQYAANSLYYDRLDGQTMELLGEPSSILDLDFHTATEAACRNRTEVQVTRDGLCHGWLGWFRARIGEAWLSTSPLHDKTHWRQAFLPVAEPITVSRGDLLLFELHRQEYGDWTWTVEYDNRKQRQSTFLSRVHSLDGLRKGAGTHRPVLTQRGRSTQEVLSRLDALHTNAEIAQFLAEAYPEHFVSDAHALDFVRDIVDQYAE